MEKKIQKPSLPLPCKIIYILGAVSLLLYVIFLLSPDFADFFNKV